MVRFNLKQTNKQFWVDGCWHLEFNWNYVVLTTSVWLWNTPTLSSVLLLLLFLCLSFVHIQKHEIMFFNLFILFSGHKITSKVSCFFKTTLLFQKRYLFEVGGGGVAIVQPFLSKWALMESLSVKTDLGNSIFLFLRETVCVLSWPEPIAILKCLVMFCLFKDWSKGGGLPQPCCNSRSHGDPPGWEWQQPRLHQQQVWREGVCQSNSWNAALTGEDQRPLCSMLHLFSFEELTYFWHFYLHLVKQWDLMPHQVTLKVNWGLRTELIQKQKTLELSRV